MLLYLLLMVVFLFFSAFFSGMEAAIFSVSRFRLKTLFFESKKGTAMLDLVKKYPSRTLAALLLSNLVVNISAASVAAIILLRIISHYHFSTTIAFIIELLVMTSVLLVCGEITPKVIAFANAEFFALRFSGIVYIISSIWSPLTKLSEKLINWIFPSNVSQVVSESEIRYMIKEAKQHNILDESEEAIGYQILTFGKKKVSEIMTPRPKVVGVRIDDDIETAQKIIRETHHSRIVVYDKTGDVCGVLYAKNLFAGHSSPGIKVADLMREPNYVPETKSLETLLTEFRKKGVHLGVVVDEFGDVKGIVTLEDILETLFGEIVDEYDSPADIPYRTIGQDTYLFDGDISVAEINRLLKTRIFGEKGERLSVFIIKHVGRFPREKETVHFGEFDLTVFEIHNRIIKKVVIKRT